jgi:hypothetical protein
LQLINGVSLKFVVIFHVFIVVFFNIDAVGFFSINTIFGSAILSEKVGYRLSDFGLSKSA